MKQFAAWLYKTYPQNYLIRYPFRGAFIAAAFCFVFLVIYLPFEIQPSNYSLSLEATMAIYSLLITIPHVVIVLLLKRTRFFGNLHRWNIVREACAIVIVLLGMGVFIYFMGFIVESPENRWNFTSLFSSIKIVFFTGIVLYSFFTALNFRLLFAAGVNASSFPTAPLIHIHSQLKSEALSFKPDEFVYAKSDSNYVVFYLSQNGSIQKRMVRNSITEIERQLTGEPAFFRTHRAFIVNLEKVQRKKGNALGYKLSLEGVEEDIPVARNKTRAFNKLLPRLT